MPIGEGVCVRKHTRGMCPFNGSPHSKEERVVGRELLVCSCNTRVLLVEPPLIDELYYCCIVVYLYEYLIQKTPINYYMITIIGSSLHLELGD